MTVITNQDLTESDPEAAPVASEPAPPPMTTRAGSGTRSRAFVGLPAEARALFAVAQTFYPPPIFARRSLS